MSSPEPAMPGIKGKRVPGRPGRFDPSEPLHMTTRRAAKTTSTNDPPSLNGSLDDDESARGSMDDTRPFTSHSNNSTFSANSRRLSESFGPVVTPEIKVNGTHTDVEMTGTKDEPQPTCPSRQSPSPSRKRKRSSSPAAPPTPQPQTETAETSFDSQREVVPYADNVDSVEVVHPDELSEREMPLSQITTDSGEDAVRGVGTLAAPSMDATPALSGQVSPVTSDSNNSPDGVTNAKQLNAALEAARREQEGPGLVDERDENDDVPVAVNDLVDAEDAYGPVQSGDDGRPQKGKFGGRRRAKHQNPRVELAMQRQSELKSAYRAIARAQKAVLAEIAQRTVDSLETDAELHMHAAEHDGVRAGLKAALDRRRARLEAQHDMSASQLKLTLEDQQQVIKATRKRRVEDMQERFLDDIDYKLLEIARAAKVNTSGTNYETEDEDDTIPRLKGMKYKWKRTDALPPAYDSRSRVTLETRRMTGDVESRMRMRALLDALPKGEQAHGPHNFTVGNTARREVAVEKKNSILNAKTLAAAAEEVERLEKLVKATEAAKIPVIPNEEAVGLQLLGDLASRPSIVGSVPLVGQGNQESDAYIGQTPPREMPPHLQLQTHYGPSRIPVEMSPRTTQALSNRFDSGRPPPSTPQQDAKSLAHSPPGTGRKDFQLQSPQTTQGRTDDHRPLFAKHHSHRSEGQIGPTGEQRKDERTANGHPVAIGREPFSLGLGKSSTSIWPESVLRRGPLFGTTGPNQDQRSPHALPPRPPVGIPAAQERRIDHDPAKDAFPFGFLRRRTSEQQDPFSRASAMDSRDGRPAFIHESGRRATMDSEQSPPRRWSSTLTAGDANPEPTNNTEPRKTKNNFPLKTNKAERGGMPRRQWALSKKMGALPTSIPNSLPGKPGPASAISPTNASSPFPQSALDRPGPLAPWQRNGPPLRSPLGPPPPSAFGRPSSANQSHPSPFSSGVRDPYGPRDNGSRPRPPASIWNQPSPSPLYALPQQHQPPPTGISSNAFDRYGPQPSFGPPPSQQTPRSTQPPSTLGSSFGSQFGGQPLAPALNQGFQPSGFRPTQPLPAFAQQAQQQNQNNNSSSGNGPGNRRRTQSDVSFPKFQPYQPKFGGGGR